VIIGNLSEFTQRLDDGLARCEHECILNEGIIGCLERHRKLCGDNCTNEDSFARPHGQSKDVTGIAKSECFAQGLEAKLAHEDTVAFDTFPERA